MRLSSQGGSAAPARRRAASFNSFGTGSGAADPWHVWTSPNRGGAVNVDSGARTVEYNHTNGNTGSFGSWTVYDAPSPILFKHNP